jgi:hypothetical protein
VPRLLLPAIAMLIVAAITTGLAARGDFRGRDDDRDDEREGRGEYAIGLWGDLPYSDLQATSARGCAQPRGVRVRAADCSRQSNGCTSAVIGCEQD